MPSSAAAKWLTWAMIATASACGELRTKSMPVSILGRIEPAPNWLAFKCVSASSAVICSSRCSSGFAVVDARVFDGRENHERRCLKMTGEQAGGAILVDDCGHTADAAVGSTATGIPPPPQQTTICPALTSCSIAGISMILRGNGEGTTRRKRPLPSSRICQPSFMRCASACASVSIGPMALFGFLKCRIVWVDEHGRDDRRHVAGEIAPVHRVRQALGDHVAHAGLGVGDANFERNRVELAAGDLDATQDVADLRAVAVRDDQVVAALDRIAEDLGRFADLGELLVDIADLAGSADCVSAESDDESFADVGHEGTQRMRGCADVGGRGENTACILPLASRHPIILERPFAHRAGHDGLGGVEAVFGFWEDDRLRAVDHGVGYFRAAIGGQAVHVDGRLLGDLHAVFVADPILVLRR